MYSPPKHCFVTFLIDGQQVAAGDVMLPPPAEEVKDNDWFPYVMREPHLSVSPEELDAAGIEYAYEFEMEKA